MAEIHRLLKLEEDKSPQALPTASFSVGQEAEKLKDEVPAPGSAPIDLPTAPLGFVQLQERAAEEIEEPLVMPGVKPKQAAIQHQQKTVPGRRTFGGLLAYPLIFIVAFLIFYTLLNLPSLASQVKAWFIKPQDEEILQEDLSEYNQWIEGYFFSVGKRELLGPNNDIDHDGLTNYEEFVLGTNPTLLDSAGNGVSDGVKVIDGLNYWGNGPLTEAQKSRIKRLDLNMINNRINYNSAVGANNSATEHKIAFDQSREGKLSIPRLNLQVPLVWSKDPADFETDLTRGVIHYPGTAMPGEQGTMYVSGHSSDYIWKRNDYKRVFAQINALQPGDDIFVDAYGLDGKLYNFRYQVTGKNVYKPDDQAQFIDSSGALLNLSTCWPIGTAKDRYVVTGVLKPL